MVTRDLFADFLVKGLPVIGSTVGGIYAFKAPKAWQTFAYAILGWGCGWGASRGIQWLMARADPGLPANNADALGPGTGYEGGSESSAMSGIRYVNLEEEKERLRQEHMEKRRSRGGRKIEVLDTPEDPVRELESQGNPTTAIVPLATKPQMVYGGLRVGKNVLGVTRR